MRKLRLNVEQLEVESFSPQGGRAGSRGTVEGQAKATYGCTEGWAGCDAETIGYTCNVQCSHTNIGGSCDYVSCEGYFYCPPDWTQPVGCEPVYSIDECP